MRGRGVSDVDRPRYIDSLLQSRTGRHREQLAPINRIRGIVDIQPLDDKARPNSGDTLSISLSPLPYLEVEIYPLSSNKSKT